MDPKIDEKQTRKKLGRCLVPQACKFRADRRGFQQKIRNRFRRGARPLYQRKGDRIEIDGG